MKVNLLIVFSEIFLLAVGFTMISFTSLLRLVYCLFSLFVSVSLARVLSILLICLKSSFLLLLSLGFFFIVFLFLVSAMSTYLYNSHPRACFGFILLFFSWFIEVRA